MPDITQILKEVEAGQAGATEQLLSLVYDELRALAAAKMTSERLDHTLQGTALVHEAYLRLVGSAQKDDWSSRGHFFAAAAEAMRRMLIDHARQRKSQKRTLREKSPPQEAIEKNAALCLDDMLDFNEGLILLEESAPKTAELVKLRIFAGLSVDDAAAVLGIPVRTAYRDWSFAQAWLFRHLKPNHE